MSKKIADIDVGEIDLYTDEYQGESGDYWFPEYTRKENSTTRKIRAVAVKGDKENG